MRFAVIGTGFVIALLAGCTTPSGGKSGEASLIADVKQLVTTSYQCQNALGREPHYSAIESSETILKALGRSPEDADKTVRGWLKGLIASSKQPDMDRKACKDTLLKQAEKVRIEFEARKARG
ncbi:hypothetical protein [Phyllobacterium sp. P30BS-XVII]|uniref:hypothetical protein n=1 Tax=Phyllobacterium sp. P30BS-XVII TaxID=2587046 RepID=UPI0015F8154F|nr:hypothetical protein [Phyllobacterium sp. P30BS-XVII]MBA8900027.1 hypothetical protein [Phyllobacterium sp. P30BS-XVII]